jgi:ubiquinone/menaquinone biosynthesis C-methylase UbiE
MSTYETYRKTARNYDKTRVPVGLEILLRCLTKSGRALDEINLLDAGCGTGNYSHGLIDFVRRIDAVDMNQDMLAVASRKLKNYMALGRVSFHCARIDALPFDNSTFDAVMINQVLHHVDNPGDEDYPAHHRIFREFHRVLRSEGILVVSTCSQEQLRHGYWYYDLIPEAAEMLRRRFAPLSTLIKVLSQCGFKYHGSYVPVDAILQGDSYFDLRGPLKKEWRDGDSTFALATKDELDRACDRIREMDSKGVLSSYIEAHDRQRKMIGQATFLMARRS